MPTLAQRLREEGKEQGIQQGIEKGHLLGKQEALILLLANRFHLTEADKQLVSETKESDKLDTALKMVISAEAKEKVLGILKNGSPS